MPTKYLLREEAVEDAAAQDDTKYSLGSVLNHVTFSRTEGIIPAPESSRAIKAAIDEAKKADAEGKSRVILFNLSGHGHFDLGAYDQYFAGKLEDFEYPREAVERAMANLPVVDL